MTHEEQKTGHAPIDRTRSEAPARRGDAPVEGADGRPIDPAKPQEPNPWMRDGADAPDAADIEDPGSQL